MPDLVPVDHDPFSTFVPVDHDPFAVNPDAALAASMTHWPEVPNPAAPYIQGTKDFLKGGLSEVLKGQGVQLPEWSNRVGDVLQSEAANTAIGMTTPLKGMKGITAYHGSPHDFDKFDLSHIGTGEGAQAYGHGLYFAENEGVARDYKNSIAPKNFGSLEEDKAFKVLQSYGGNRDVAIKNLRSEASSLREQAARRKAEGLGTGGGWNVIADQSDKAAELLEKGWKPPEGKMYQVSINADPEHFLDWDKPLSEQHPEVIRKLEDAYPGMVEQGRSVQQSLFPYGNPKPQVTEALRAAGIPGIKYLDQQSRAPIGRTEFASLTPAENDIVNRIGYGRAPDVTFAEEQANPAAAWEKNLRHWQSLEPSGERRAVIDKLIKNKDFTPVDLTPQNQTRNFVVFDDRLIDIMKKYGLAGLSALPAAGAYHFRTQQVDHDPFERQ